MRISNNIWPTLLCEHQIWHSPVCAVSLLYFVYSFLDYTHCCLGMHYQVNFWEGIDSNGFHIKFSTQGYWKKSKSWGPFWSYQLNSAANLTYLQGNPAQWAKSAVLFSWQLKNSPQYFDFFNCHGCQTFILHEIHYYLSPPKSWHNNSILGSVFLDDR